MAANQYGIDLGDLYRTTAAVKGARTQNRLSQLKLAETEREIAERPAKLAAEKERKNLIAQNITGALSGDESALNQLYVLDINSAKEIASRIDAMSEKEKKQVEANQLELGQMAFWVEQSETPEEASERMNVVLSKLPEESRAQALAEIEQLGGDPKKYAQYTLAKLRDVKTIFADPKVVNFGDEQVMTKGGVEVGRTKKPTKSTDEGGVKSADESLIYRLSGGLFDAIFDQDGNITNLDPTLRGKVQAITDRASSLFSKGGYTRSGAVTQAAKDFGIEVPDSGSTVDNNDPLGLR